MSNENMLHLFLGKMCFTSNDGSQNTFANRSTLGTLELKRNKGTYYVLIGNLRQLSILNLSHCILLSGIA